MLAQLSRCSKPSSSLRVFHDRASRPCQSLRRFDVSSRSFFHTETAFSVVPNHHQSILERSSAESTAPSLCNLKHPIYSQVRWKRRDGNKAFSRERPPTRKQRKKYNRQKGASMDGKTHGAPGSKAGTRREFVRQTREDILNPAALTAGDEEDLDEYTMEDALFDDLIGNTAYLTAQPTPEPKYLGRSHKFFYNQVAEQMGRYRKQVELLEQQSDDTDKKNEDKALLDLEQVDLPTDEKISLALRAFRDRYGTKRAPVGIVKALEHLVSDLGVPLTALGEHCWTTLLTCCANPTEGRKGMDIMRQQKHEISSYSWSILVDLYAKQGDFVGCQQVHQEMARAGVAPTLASFTSLLSACARVCSNGRIAHSIRARAGEMGWEAWQEMRVVGIDPDVMAYGAMLQWTGARGQPERALNLLEEMEQFEVKPTTLCFTNALRAVAKSHATAVRYERGSSRKNRRREFVTAHHGKLAHQIVIRAENAHVEQDEGFVSALIMCSAVAGDAATAKAIYTASQIRGFTELRTIGSDDHLKRLRGEITGNSEDEVTADPLQLTDGDLPTNSVPQKRTSKTPSFGEREYGKDSRSLTAILHACAKAVDKNGMGTIWQGRENNGYLCENSLRLIQARRVPEYVDTSIPGQSRTDALTWRGEHRDEDGYREGKRKSRKFSGVEEDVDAGTTLDELDSDLERMYVDKDGRRKKEYRATTFDDIWRKKYGNDGLTKTDPEALEQGTVPQLSLPFRDFDLDGSVMTITSDSSQAPSSSGEISSEPKNEMHFDYESMSWQPGPAPVTEVSSISSKPLASDTPMAENKKREEEELYFDTDEMKWKHRPRSAGRSETMPDLHEQASEEAQEHATDEEFGGFEEFFDALKLEMEEEGEMEGITEQEARELFRSVKNEYLEFANMNADDYADAIDKLDDEDVSRLLSETNQLNSGAQSTEPKQDFQQFVDELKDEWREDGANLDEGAGSSTLDSSTAPSQRDRQLVPQLQRDESFSESSTPTSKPLETQWYDPDEIDQVTQSLALEAEGSRAEAAGELLQHEERYVPEDNQLSPDVSEGRIEQLRMLLPGFPEKRLRKISNMFQQNLGDPSLLDLTNAVRENMPDYVTNTWLKQASDLASRFVVDTASKKGLVDNHVLSGILEVMCAAGRLEKAIDFHQTEFSARALTPTSYNDRLVLQMLVENNRFQRALGFKQKIEDSGRTIDIPSYGTLIDKSSRHGQLGTSLLLIKECVQVHGAPPNEASLKNFRHLCKQHGVQTEDGIESLIGKDPVAWLKHGEANLKREMSKKGRRMVLYPRNRMMQV